jgi:hypothetical protein
MGPIRNTLARLGRRSSTGRWARLSGLAVLLGVAIGAGCGPGAGDRGPKGHSLPMMNAELPIVRGTVDGRPMNLLLDRAASGELWLPASDLDAGPGAAQREAPSSVSLFGETWSVVPTRFEPTGHTGGFGILGGEFFERHIIVFDFEHALISAYRDAEKEKLRELLAKEGWRTISAWRQADRVWVSASVNGGTPGSWLVDTGAFSTCLVAREGRAGELRGEDWCYDAPIMIGERWEVSASFYAADVTVNGLTARMTVSVTEDRPPGARLPRECAGVLGYDFLRQWRRVAIDVEGCQLYVEPWKKPDHSPAVEEAVAAVREQLLRAQRDSMDYWPALTALAAAGEPRAGAELRTRLRTDPPSVYRIVYLSHSRMPRVYWELALEGAKASPAGTELHADRTTRQWVVERAALQGIDLGLPAPPHDRALTAREVAMYAAVGKLPPKPSLSERYVQGDREMKFACLAAAASQGRPAVRQLLRLGLDASDAAMRRKAIAYAAAAYNRDELKQLLLPLADDPDEWISFVACAADDRLPKGADLDRLCDKFVHRMMQGDVFETTSLAVTSWLLARVDDTVCLAVGRAGIRRLGTATDDLRSMSDEELLWLGIVRLCQERPDLAAQLRPMVEQSYAQLGPFRGGNPDPKRVYLAGLMLVCAGLDDWVKMAPILAKPGWRQLARVPVDFLRTLIRPMEAAPWGDATWTSDDKETNLPRERS